MARHRNVRTMNYEDEYYDEDDYLGHSVEDNYCISPGTAAQFTFNRDRDVNFASYMGEQEKIPEEEEAQESDGEQGSLNDSGGSHLKATLSDIEHGKLNSCLEEARNVLGDSVPEHIMCQIIIKNKFNLEASLNEMLTPGAAPKPQRQPRERRNRSQGDDDEDELDEFIESLESKSPDKKHPFLNLKHFPNQTNKSQISDLSDRKNLVLLMENRPPGSTKISENVKFDTSVSKTSQSLMSNKENTSERDHDLSSSDGQKMSKTCNVSLASLAKQNQSKLGILQKCEKANEQKLSNLSIAEKSSDVGNRPKASLKELTNQDQKGSVMKQENEKCSSHPEMSGKKGEIGMSNILSLSDLAKGNKKVDAPPKSKPQGLSLSDLAKQHKNAGTLVSGTKEVSSQKQGLSLADLAKQNQTKHVESKPPVSLKQLASELPKKGLSLSELAASSKMSEKVPSSTSKPGTQAKNLADLACEKSVKKPSANLTQNEVKIISQEPSSGLHCDTQGCVLRSLRLVDQMISGDSLLNKDLDSKKDIHVISPSVFGKTISFKVQGQNAHVHRKKNKYPQFSYKNQMRNNLNVLPHFKDEIIPFKFSTPSPDDIVKEKQKAAFTRTGH